MADTFDKPEHGLEALVREARIDATSARERAPKAAKLAERKAAPPPAEQPGQLYEKRKRIHPKRVNGKYRNVKWAVMIGTLGIYYLLPWVRWDRGPSAPDQAVLLDIPERRFYFFFIEIWPQEFYYLTGLLILGALALFLVTSLFGRVWCGYTCPQTVWTDLFIYVERFVQGDRNKRLRLDRMGWTFEKIWKRTTTHSIWLVIAVATGGAWVFYFGNAPDLIVDLFTGEAATAAYVSIAAFTFTTYSLGGLMREQVCTYMCPWPRIQGAMFDEHTYLVSYKEDRGEPRGPHKKGEPWDGRGDCIDCHACVVACPAGIDIRNGAQLECIQCALCIDACDEIMDKVGRPRGLIDYETMAMPEARARGETPMAKLLRPRTYIYSALIAVVGGIMLYGLGTRADLDVNVLRDRNPIFVQLADGSIRNGYTVKILNKANQERTFELDVAGFEGALMTRPTAIDEPHDRITVPADELRSVKIFITAPPAALADPEFADGAEPIILTVRDLAGDTVYDHQTAFRAPEL